MFDTARLFDAEELADVRLQLVATRDAQASKRPRDGEEEPYDDATPVLRSYTRSS
jgi:hypothetical protein